MKRKRKGATPAQLLLATHLKELGVNDVEYEYQFLADRKFRFDLYSAELHIGFECDGHHNGRHGAGWGNDNEKNNLAQLHGFRILRFKNSEIMKGQAKEFLKTFMWGGLD